MILATPDRSKILITDDLADEGLALLHQAGVTFDIRTGLTPNTVADCIAAYEGLIVRSRVRVTAAVLERATSLKVIGRAGVGLDNIDLDAARRQGVIVTNTPEANTVATAEHALALILALCRRLPQANASLKAGRWTRRPFIGTELQGKTLGLIGLGRVGRQVAAYGRAFGLIVIASDPYLKGDPPVGLELVSLAELYRRSDIISLHASLTPETAGMINHAAIAQMKPGVYLVNTARGGLVDEATLVAGLAAGHIGAAALDVFATEPLPPSSPLLA